MYPDGGGLYLQVTARGARSWIYRYMLNGSPRYMGLGPLHTVTLADARVKGFEARRLRLSGVDPIEARDDALAEARVEAARSITFKDAAEAYIEAHKVGWRNAKHADQWRNTLETYAYPVIGSLPVQGVDVALVMKVLEPIWATKTETASRVRGRIESVLDWASARGYRLGENPARWRGHLENLLPRRSRVQKVEHYPAVPYGEVGAFLVDLRRQEGTAASAFEFVILTACRTGEVIGGAVTVSSTSRRPCGRSRPSASSRVGNTAYPCRQARSRSSRRCRRGARRKVATVSCSRAGSGAGHCPTWRSWPC